MGGGGLDSIERNKSKKFWKKKRRKILSINLISHNFYKFKGWESQPRFHPFFGFISLEFVWLIDWLIEDLESEYWKFSPEYLSPIPQVNLKDVIKPDAETSEREYAIANFP